MVLLSGQAAIDVTTGTTTSATTPAFYSNPGDTIVVTIAVPNSTGSVSSVTDGTNTYNAVLSYQQAGMSCFVYVAKNVLPPTRTATTFQVTAVISPGSNYWAIAVGSYSGVFGSNYSVVGAYVSSPTAQFTFSGANAPFQNAVIVPSVCSWGPVSTSGLPAGFGDTQGSGSSRVHQIYGLGGSQTFTWSADISASQAWIGVLVVFWPATTWNALTNGKPMVAVSPVGTADGYAFNNGADYGPDTPGTSTCGVQEAVNALPSGGGTVRLLVGLFYVTNQITVQSSGVRLEGSGSPLGGYGSPTNNGSAIVDSRTTASGDLILVQAPTPTTQNTTITGVEIEGIAIVADTISQGSTAAAIHLNAYTSGSYSASLAFCRVARVSVHSSNAGTLCYANCIRVTGASSSVQVGVVHLEQLYLVDASSAMMFLNFAQDVFVRGCFITADTSSPDGIQIQDCPSGPICVADCDVTGSSGQHVGNGLKVYCDTNDCTYIYLTRVNFDNCSVAGVHLTGTGGSAFGLRFVECYMSTNGSSSNLANGFWLDECDVFDLVIADCTITTNSKYGVYLSPTTTHYRVPGIALLGNTIAHNSVGSQFSYDGIYIATEAYYRIDTNVIGDDAVYSGVIDQNYGINGVVNPSHTYWVVTGNIMIGNNSGSVNGTLGSQVRNANNWP